MSTPSDLCKGACDPNDPFCLAECAVVENCATTAYGVYEGATTAYANRNLIIGDTIQLSQLIATTTIIKFILYQTLPWLIIFIASIVTFYALGNISGITFFLLLVFALIVAAAFLTLMYFDIRATIFNGVGQIKDEIQNNYAINGKVYTTAIVNSYFYALTFSGVTCNCHGGTCGPT